MLILTYIAKLVTPLLGKFQMEVLSGCGHAVHEDLPDKVSSEYMYSGTSE